MTNTVIGVGIVGCGNIATSYATDIVQYEHMRLVGVHDIDAAKAEALAAESNCQTYPSLEALLADPAIDLVINLTIHHAHYAVTRQALLAHKHVYSEKPLAITYAEAQVLVDLAQKQGVRLGCSPFTYLGEAQQTALQHLRSGQLGTVRVAYAEVNWGRIESWHPAPAPFYDVGVLWDVGVYPLAVLTAFLGPARRVHAYGTVLLPDRTTKDGTPFHITTPDFVVALIELASGTLVRLTTNFYVKTSQQNSGIEFHGDAGSLSLSSWFTPDAWVGAAPFGEAFVALDVPDASQGIRWGRGVADMAFALIEDHQHRVTGEHAAHVVEILEATSEALRTGQPVTIQSSFVAPQWD